MRNGEGIRVWQGDITTLAVDAIVNAANASLLGGGGVDGAIHRAAGPDLTAFCAGLDGCSTGAARITPGFHLPARHVIHTVGPVWRGGGHGEATALADCYRNSLALAEAHALRSIAFPAISCGVYGFPPEAAARIAVENCRAALGRPCTIGEIVLVAFDQRMASLLNETLGQMA